MCKNQVRHKKLNHTITEKVWAESALAKRCELIYPGNDSALAQDNCLQAKQ